MGCMVIEATQTAHYPLLLENLSVFLFMLVSICGVSPQKHEELQTAESLRLTSSNMT